MADAQQLADEETKVRAWAVSRNISADTCDIIVAMGFSSLEALSCLDADDLRKSKAPIGQQKLLLRCCMPWGQYEFTRMPQSLMNSPSTFERIMELISGSVSGG